MNRINLFLVIALGLLVSSQVNAGGENYTFRIGDGDGAGGSVDGSASVGGTGEVRVFLDSANGVAIGLAGWSLGMCHDPAFLTLEDEADIDNGDAIATVNGGFAPAFHGKTNIPDQGWTVGAIVNFDSFFSVLPADDQEFYIVSYTGVALTEGEGTELTFCEIGSPVVLIVVNEGKGDLTPNTSDGSMQVIVDPFFRFSLADETICVGDDVDAVSFVTTMSIEQISGPSGIETNGFSLGIFHDFNVIEYDLVDVNPGPTTTLKPDARDVGVLAAVRAGQGPGFFGINAVPGGVTIGCVYNVEGATSLTFSDGPEAVVEFHMTTVAGALDNLPDCPETLDTLLIFTDQLGTPNVPNVIVADGGSTSYALSDGSLEAIGATIGFGRTSFSAYTSGDCNDDAKVDIGDAIFLFNHLFHPAGQTAPPPNCDLACDVNGDGKVNQTDAVYVLNYQFLDGPAPEGSGDCNLTGCDPEHTSCL